jgi:hypothetical protein
MSEPARRSDATDVRILPVGLDGMPGATHLFEELGALDQVIDLAGRWFIRHLAGRTREG